jgi:hypothetical protein
MTIQVSFPKWRDIAIDHNERLDSFGKRPSAVEKIPTSSRRNLGLVRHGRGTIPS